MCIGYNPMYLRFRKKKMLRKLRKKNIFTCWLMTFQRHDICFKEFGTFVISKISMENNRVYNVNNDNIFNFQNY